jgi:hypothetical protein
MREAQARMKTPYLVLSGHVKPGYVFNLHKLFLSEKKLRNLLILEVLGEIK